MPSARGGRWRCPSLRGWHWLTHHWNGNWWRLCGHDTSHSTLGVVPDEGRKHETRQTFGLAKGPWLCWPSPPLFSFCVWEIHIYSKPENCYNYKNEKPWRKKQMTKTHLPPLGYAWLMPTSKMVYYQEFDITVHGDILKSGVQWKSQKERALVHLESTLHIEQSGSGEDYMPGRSGAGLLTQTPTGQYRCRIRSRSAS